MTQKAMRLLPLLILLALLLAACVGEDVPASEPTEQILTDPATAPEESVAEPLYTEPEAPVMTFPAEPVTDPVQESVTDPLPQNTVPQETAPQESYSGGPSGDENELPAIPF